MSRNRLPTLLVALLLVSMALVPAAAAQGPSEGKNGTENAPGFVQGLLGSIGCMLSGLFDALPVPDGVAEMFHNDGC